MKLLSSFTCTIALLFVLLANASLQAGSVPELLDPVFVPTTATMEPIAATTVDWTNDGLEDLLVGDGANIRLYTNIGTNANPVFDGYTELRANDKVISDSGDG